MSFLPYSGHRYQLVGSKLINAITQEEIPVVDEKCRLCWVLGDRDYDFNVILYLCKSGEKIPDHLIGEMVVVFGDGDSTNTSIENMRYTFKSPVTYAQKPGFFYIPGLCNYVINSAGVLHSLFTNEEKTWTIHNGTQVNNRRGGYHYVSVVDDCGNQTKITRHRALLIAFKGLPTRWKSLVCNHINGIKGDDRVDNLEWVSYAENNQHAIDSGLRNNGCKAILVKNLKDNSIARYVSIEAAAKAVGYSRSVMRYRIEKRNNVAYDDYLQFKKDDGTEWVDLDFTNPEPLVYNVEIKAFDVMNNKILVFPNSGIAGKVIGVPSLRVLQHCYNVDGQSLLNGYYVRETKDFKKPEWSKDRLAVLRENGCRNGKMCYAYCDGVLIFRGLVVDFAKHVGIAVSKVYGALESGCLAGGKYRLKLLE